MPHRSRQCRLFLQQSRNPRRGHAWLNFNPWHCRDRFGRTCSLHPNCSLLLRRAPTLNILSASDIPMVNFGLLRKHPCKAVRLGSCKDCLRGRKGALRLPAPLLWGRIKSDLGHPGRIGPCDKHNKKWKRRSRMLAAARRTAGKNQRKLMRWKKTRRCSCSRAGLIHKVDLPSSNFQRPPTPLNPDRTQVTHSSAGKMDVMMCTK